MNNMRTIAEEVKQANGANYETFGNTHIHFSPDDDDVDVCSELRGADEVFLEVRYERIQICRATLVNMPDSAVAQIIVSLLLSWG